MDRVTRYPIFSIARSPRLAGLDPSGDTSYTFEVVDVGPEASGWGQDKPQAWPAHQEARLNATRTGAFSSPRAFAGQSSPWTLWREGDKDEEAKACHLDTRDAQPQRPGDLEQERWVVIQSQALRKSSTVATLHGTPGLPDPSSTQPQPGPLEESAVDREQIDFLAARQQFLSLEQASAGAPLHPAARVAPARAAPGVDQAPRAPGGPLPMEREVLPPEKRVGGLPAASPVRAAHDAASPAQAGSRRLPKETPIEREIRLAQEREADLREQRGLRRASSQQELVEIPARPLLLTTVSPAAAPRRERGRPSLYVQRDLAQGTRREEDHRRREEDHRRRQEPEATQSGLRRAFSSDSILDLASAGGAADPGPQVRKVNRIPADAYQPFLRAGGRAVPAGPAGPAVQARAQPRGLSADEAGAAGPPRRPLEAPGTPPGRQRECPRPPQGRGRAHGAVVRREYFHLSPLRFRVPHVPPRAEGPGGGGWEAGGTPARGRPRPPSSELLEREVESVLQREREAAEERRTALFPEVFSPPPAHGDDQDSRSSSAASGVAGSYSVSGTHFFSPVHLHSGLVWRAEAPADPAPEQRRRKEQQYASISASDHIDWEVLEATRVTHHKSAMARRWEAGIYASEGQD